MPSGQPKDPEATRAKRRETAAKRAAHKQANIAMAKELAANDFNNEHIAEKMGISESSVLSLLKPSTPVRKHTARRPAQKTSEPAEGALFVSKDVVDDLKYKVESLTHLNEDLSRNLEIAERRVMGLVDLIVNNPF